MKTDKESGPLFEPFKDSVGNDILEGDICRVFHFIGARKRKHYMYKQAGEYHVSESGRRFLWMLHLPNVGPHHNSKYALYVDSQEEFKKMVVVNRGKFRNNKTDDLKRSKTLRD